MEYKDLGKTSEKIPALGQGTWGIGGWLNRSTRNDRAEMESLRRGLDHEMTFIDTAEMYGSGHSEEIVSEAIKGRREKVFIATKVSPEHLRYDDVIRSCEASLRRLKVNTVDLYQVHWPNPDVPIKETMRAMERLVELGKIRYIGVSNFLVSETREAEEALSRNMLVSNQVEYNIVRREIEEDLLPYCQSEGITVIAYTPLAKGRIPRSGAVSDVAVEYGKTVTQVALNWLISKPMVVAIPKAVKQQHMLENLGALGWRLSLEDIEKLDRE